MRTDNDGFLVQALAPRVSRQSFGVKATELVALEKSKNRSLQALARRIRKALADNDEWWRERFRRSEALAEFARKRRAEIDADPVRKAAEEQERAEFAERIQPMAEAFLGRVNSGLRSK